MNRLRMALTLTRRALLFATLVVRAILLRPLTYLALYVSVIFAFAYLYNSRNDAIFYAPYAKLEAASRGDYEAIRAEIEKSIAKTDPFSRVDDTGWILNPSNLHVTELSIEETGEFSFTLSFFATHWTKDRKDIELAGPIENFRVNRRWIATDDGNQFCRFVAFPPDRVRQPIFTRLFAQSPSITAPMLCWNGHVEYQFGELKSGWSGDAKALSGSFWRMLYLSAITITSVGYGDIVPISNTARMLCGLEAVLGWLIAGFFLAVVTIRPRS